MILGISADGVRAHAVLVNDSHAAVARGESERSGRLEAIVEAAGRALAATEAASLSAVGLAFSDPSPKSWPADLSLLSAAIGPSVQVKIVSAGNALALAETWYGAGRGVRDLIAFSMGPSVSAGMISNGCLLSGAHGVAGSVAWLALNPVEREDYRKMGCLEAEGGSAGLVRRLIWRLKSGDHSRVLDAVGGDFVKIQLDDILNAARAGDGVSISVVRDTVKYLAMAVSNIASVMDPDVIVLGGLLESAEDLLAEPIRQECARRMPPAVHERARITVSTLGSDAAPLGAARFAATGSQLP